MFKMYNNYYNLLLKYLNSLAHLQTWYISTQTHTYIQLFMHAEVYVFTTGGGGGGVVVNYI